MLKSVALFICVVLLVAGGCAAKNEQQGTTDLDYATGYFYELSESNVICVSYPILLADGADRSNEMISDFVREEINRRCFQVCELTEAKELPADFPSEKMYETNYSNYALRVDYRVTICTNDVLSIVFEGMINGRTAAHPIQLLFTLNMDPKNGHIIHYDDRYVIDDALYATFAEYAQKEVAKRAGGEWPESLSNFSEKICSKEKFLDGIVSSDEWYVFFTAEGVGISYPVAHALGDHWEVILPYVELKAISIHEE